MGHPPTTPANLLTYYGLDAPMGAVAGDFARVHPTQLYEAALSAGIFVWLRRAWRGRNESRIDGWWMAGLFLMLHGAARVGIELIRAKADRVVGPVSVDLLLAVAAVAAGAWLVARHGAKRGEDST
jgi:prolipoprotein diacylglyceryltransferase